MLAPIVSQWVNFKVENFMEGIVKVFTANFLRIVTTQTFCNSDDQHVECNSDDQHVECNSDDQHVECNSDDQHVDCNRKILLSTWHVNTFMC